MKMKMSLVLVQLFATYLVCTFCGVVDSTFVDAVQLKPSKAEPDFQVGEFYLNDALKTSAICKQCSEKSSLWKVHVDQKLASYLKECNPETGAYLNNRILKVSPDGLETGSTVYPAPPKKLDFYLAVNTEEAMAGLGEVFRINTDAWKYIFDVVGQNYQKNYGSAYLGTGIKHDKMGNAKLMLTALSNGRRKVKEGKVFIISEYPVELSSRYEMLKVGDVYRKVEENEVWIVKNIVSLETGTNVTLKMHAKNGFLIQQELEPKKVEISELFNKGEWKKIKMGMLKRAALNISFGSALRLKDGMYIGSKKVYTRRQTYFLACLVVFILSSIGIGIFVWTYGNNADLGIGTILGGIGIGVLGGVVGYGATEVPIAQAKFDGLLRFDFEEP